MTTPASLPRLIRPRYPIRRANKGAVVFSGMIGFDDDGGTAEARGRLLLSWLPDPRLEFVVDSFLVLERPEMQVRIRGATRPARALLSRAQLATLGKTYSRGFLAEQLTRGPEDGLHSVVFHLANFPEYRGDRVRGRHGVTFARTTLHADNWVIDIDCVEGSEAVTEELRAAGGYALTHVGTVTLADGGAFNGREALEVLEALGYFLSFAISSPTQPFLLVGLDAEDRVRWRTYEPLGVRRFSPRPSWFVGSDPSCLRSGMDGLWKRWASSDDREVAMRAIYLHIDASARGVEPGLVVAQAALELMAWQTLVIERRSLSQVGFDALTAADRLRLLLAGCAIPLDVPPELAELASHAKGASPSDGPEALTQLRNRWVHPPRRGRLTRGGEERVQAWTLALWYSDLVLLHWLGHRGIYTSRLSGTVETVPWG